MDELSILFQVLKNNNIQQAYSLFNVDESLAEITKNIDLGNFSQAAFDTLYLSASIQKHASFKNWESDVDILHLINNILVEKAISKERVFLSGLITLTRKYMAVSLPSSLSETFSYMHVYTDELEQDNTSDRFMGLINLVAEQGKTHKLIILNFMYQIIDSYDKINQLKKDFK